jgi:hypothetical protein
VEGGSTIDRFNVIETAETSRGYSLLFSGHMDTAVRATDIWRRKDPGLMYT